MQSPYGRSAAGRRIAILYHSAAGGTRVVAELLHDLLSAESAVTATSIYDAGAVETADHADFIVICYPTYFLRPSTSMEEFIDRLGPSDRTRAAYVVTTYELYTENSLRACGLLLKRRGIVMTGSASIRAPGSDLTCVMPDWLCPWLYRFQRSLPDRLRRIAADVLRLSRHDGPECLPLPKWYTPFAQPLQRWFFDGFFEWRKGIRVLADRCSSCGACVSGCFRGAWAREGDGLRHDPARCELCTRCIHRCPRKAIVLKESFKDNRRLHERLYAQLGDRARTALLSPAQGGMSVKRRAEQTRRAS